MKSKDQLILEAAYESIYIQPKLRQMYLNDCGVLNEGFLDTAKTKILQPLLTFLLNKIKETSPETFDKISSAIQNKDDQAIASIFEDPQVKREQQAISQQVTTESLTYVSEEEQKPSLINSIWSWVKKNPKISAVAALAAISTLGFAVYGAGGVVALLKVAGSAALANSKGGAIGGGITSGVKSVIDQGKTGNISAKQVAKDTLKGAAIGGATSAVGGAIGAVGQAAASGIGALGNQIAQSRRDAAAEKQLGIKMQELANMKSEDLYQYAKNQAIQADPDSENSWKRLEYYINKNPEVMNNERDSIMRAIKENTPKAFEQLKDYLKDAAQGETLIKQNNKVTDTIKDTIKNMKTN